MAEKIRRLAPTARVEIAHGQMHEDDLEDVMLRFAHKEFDVLVCTTIVESGLDIPNVNTIVVDNADRLGLAQLYQLARPSRALQPPGLCVSLVPQGQAVVGGRRKAPERPARVPGPGQRLQSCPARPGNTRRG